MREKSLVSSIYPYFFIQHLGNKFFTIKLEYLRISSPF